MKVRWLTSQSQPKVIFLAESLLKCTSGTYIPIKLELFNVLIGLCADVADAPRIQIVNTLKKIEETEAHAFISELL